MLTSPPGAGATDDEAPSAVGAPDAPAPAAEEERRSQSQQAEGVAQQRRPQRPLLWEQPALECAPCSNPALRARMLASGLPRFARCISLERPSPPSLPSPPSPPSPSSPSPPPPPPLLAQQHWSPSRATRKRAEASAPTSQQEAKEARAAHVAARRRRAALERPPQPPPLPAAREPARQVARAGVRWSGGGSIASRLGCLLLAMSSVLLSGVGTCENLSSLNVGRL